jgi:integrase
MASKTNCIKNGIPYYRIRRTVGKKLDSKGIWVDDVKEFYGRNKSDAESKYEAYKLKRTSGLSSEKQHFGVMADFYVYNVFMNDGRFSAGTKERYEQVHRNYIKTCDIAGNLLENVRALDMQQFYNTVNCSNATLKAIHNLMCHFYKYLDKEGYCRNITSSLVLPKKKDSKAEADKANSQNILVWSDEEVKSIVRGLENNRIRLLLILALNTGARISELLGLQYSDICDGKLYISKQLANVAQIQAGNKKTREFEIVKPKTSSSVRNIPLSERVL